MSTVDENTVAIFRAHRDRIADKIARQAASWDYDSRTLKALCKAYMTLDLHLSNLDYEARQAAKEAEAKKSPEDIPL